MLIPRFSIRWMLCLTVVCAILFSIVGMAVRGSHWAMGVSIGMLLVVIAFGVYSMLFGLVWMFSVVTGIVGGRGSDVGCSPFAQEKVGNEENVSVSNDTG